MIASDIMGPGLQLVEPDCRISVQESYD